MYTYIYIYIYEYILIHINMYCSLLKLRRVLGVCRVCTLCFAVRAVIMLTRIPLGPFLEDAYYLLTEILPTGYMLMAFRQDPPSDNITGGEQEFENLKTSLMRLGLNNNTHMDDTESSFFKNRSDSDNYFNSSYNLSFFSNNNDSDGDSGIHHSENTRLLSGDGN
jgi:hypothetical protein